MKSTFQRTDRTNQIIYSRENLACWNDWKCLNFAFCAIFSEKTTYLLINMSFLRLQLSRWLFCKATCVSLKNVLGRQQSTTPRENIALISYQIGREKSFHSPFLGRCFIFRTARHDRVMSSYIRKAIATATADGDTLSCAIQHEIADKIYHCQVIVHADKADWYARWRQLLLLHAAHVIFRTVHNCGICSIFTIRPHCWSDAQL